MNNFKKQWIKPLALLLTACSLVEVPEEISDPSDPKYNLIAPTLLSTETLTDTKIDLTWKNNEEYTKEFIVQRKSSSESYNTIGTVANNILTFMDTACVLGTEYSYVVQGKVESNVSVNSNALIRATTFPEPSNLNVVAVSDESVLLTWSDNTGYELGFKIERDDGSGFTEVGTVLSDVTEYTETGLTFGQSYNYRIAAFTLVNTSSWATVTAATEFPAPSNLVASSVSDSQLLLTWSDNTGYESGFKIERDDGSGFTEVGTVLSDVTEYTDIGLTLGQSYDYRILAFTFTNNSDYSATVTATACMHCVVDIDDNFYETIQIGTQVWMAENLKVTHYRDGTSITNVTDAGWEYLTIEAYCAYNNNASGEFDIYGALYNWYAVNGDVDGDGVKDKELAPEGWHTPSNEEWNELETYLSNNGHNGSEGTVLRSTTGWYDNEIGNGTDDYGFAAIPSGYRSGIDGYYFDIGNGAYFWSATEENNLNAWGIGLCNCYPSIGYLGIEKWQGYAIRCVRD